MRTAFTAHCQISRYALTSLLGYGVCLASLSVSAFAQLGHVHQLNYNNSSWSDTDLTFLTGSGLPRVSSSLAALTTTPNGELHIYYIDGTTYHVRQMYFNGSTWYNEDLTSYAGGPPAVNGYGSDQMAAFAINNLQYVFYYVPYSDQNNPSAAHVHMLLYNDAVWSDQDITAEAGGPPTLLGSGIAAFTTPSDGRLHVFFELSDFGVEELYFDGANWFPNTPPGLCVTRWITGLVVQNVEHLFCPGLAADSNSGPAHAAHIYHDNGGWHSEDISMATGTLPVNSVGFGAFNIPSYSRQHPGTFKVYAVTNDRHVHQFTQSSGIWQNNDLSASASAPTDPGGGSISAFLTTPNNQYHIFYAPSPTVYQLYFNGTSFSVENLPSQPHNASNSAGLSGFSVGNLQYVYYISN